MKDKPDLTLADVFAGIGTGEAVRERVRRSRRLARWVTKFERWEHGKSAGELADKLVMAAVLLADERKKSRALARKLGVELEQRFIFLSAQKILVERELKRHQAARRGVATKLANDPKQAAKSQALEMWKAWQAGKTVHASGAAFARHVVQITPIEDTNTVQRWMREWRNNRRSA